MRSSAQHFREIINYLLPFWNKNTDPGMSKQTGLASALQYLAQTSHRRSLIVIFSDMLGGESDSEESKSATWSALQQLKFQKNEIILFHVRHAPDEALFNFPSRPFRFEDLETGERIILNPAEIRTEYINRVAAFEKEIKTRCLKNKIDFYPIDVSKDFHQVLLPFYVKRMRML
jgi:hypothetical protein